MVKLQDFCKFLNFLVLIGGGETGLLPDQVSTELSHKITKTGFIISIVNYIILPVCL